MKLSSASRIEMTHAERGQHTLEYAVLIAVVATALMAMTVYIRRSVQAHMRNVEQELNAAVEEAPAGRPPAP